MNDFLFNAQPGRTAFANGKEYLFFSGYSYLGMHFVAEFTALVKEGIDKYGWLFPSSRVSNTCLSLFDECEAMLSSLTGMEDTVLVSSGYLAGKLATALWKNEITNLNPSHPAICVDNTTYSKNYAVDSVDVLTAKITDFSFFNPDQKKILIVDDSHGIGILGKNGEGIRSKLPAAKLVLCYSLSKAWNINAGAVSCSKEIADALHNQPEYAAATPPSPAIIHAFVKGRHLYEGQRKKLQNNLQYFRSLIQAMPVVYHPELPVFILPDAVDSNRLAEKNIIISSFAYPDPDGAKHKRIVVNALHRFSDLEYLANCLEEMLV